jgi:hypothetical protein
METERVAQMYMQQDIEALAGGNYKYETLMGEHRLQTAAPCVASRFVLKLGLLCPLFCVSLIGLFGGANMLKSSPSLLRVLFFQKDGGP